MPFVKRNSNEEIVAVSQVRTGEFLEELDHNDPLLQKFLLDVSESHSPLTESDLDFVRVVEDLVDVLIAKNYILFTDLPDKAQEKMRHRQALRGKLKTHLDLLGDEDESLF